MDGNVNSAGLTKKDVRAVTAKKLKGMLNDIDNASASGAKGALSARGRIESLFDNGTFVEMGAYVRRKSNENEFEGVICGYGSVDGKLVFAFAQDPGRMKGAFDELHAKKIANLYTAAMKNGAPVVGIFDSCGAIIYDGVSALAGYGLLMKCASDASGVIPQIAVIPGVCAGSASVAAAMFDAVIAVKEKTSLYVNSPFLLGDKTATAEYAAEKGLAAVTAENEAEAYAKVRSLLGLLPSNNAEGVVEAVTGDDLNRKTAIEGIVAANGYDMKDVLNLIGDGCRFTELYAEYAPEMIVGITSFGGISCGVVANQPKENGGVITASAARKAAKLISMCDSFGMPVVTLVDSVGLDTAEASANAPYASELAKLAMAYTSSENAKVTVVLGKAYGASYTLMGSRSVGADVAFALENAAISVLPPESAVAFVWNDRVSGNNPKQAREELEEQWKEICASPADAAEKGEIDDIIASDELRQRICASVLMLAAKSEIYPDRRHAVLPL